MNPVSEKNTTLHLHSFARNTVYEKKRKKIAAHRFRHAARVPHPCGNASFSRQTPSVFPQFANSLVEKQIFDAL